MKSRAWGAALLVLMLATCSDNVSLHHYEHVQPEGWTNTDTLHFQLPVALKNSSYALSIGVRYTQAFPYEGIWLETQTCLHHPTAIRRDTLYLKLNAPDGIPVGQGVRLLQQEITLDTLKFNKGQSGTISIHHIMSREAVPGIHDIGIRLSKTS